MLQAIKMFRKYYNIFIPVILKCSQNGQILRKYNVPKLIKKEIENQNSPIGIKVIE